MRRLAALAALAALALAALRRRRATAAPARIVVGHADGSQAALDPDSPEGRRLVAVAAGALAA
ncbi:MAG TPA: hypothetical protein VFB26_07855 [Gaiellaceae bacterium]|nr:hypothetical protein [Gaiellaceae bacterium]